MDDKSGASRERVFATLKGLETDQLACMPITMRFAADKIGRKYSDYARSQRS